MMKIEIEAQPFLFRAHQANFDVLFFSQPLFSTAPPALSSLSLER